MFSEGRLRHAQNSHETKHRHRRGGGARRRGGRLCVLDEWGQRHRQRPTGTTTAITVNQTTVLGAMYPGDSAQTISGDFTNTNSGLVHVGTVTASISSVVKAGGAVAGTCDATDYTLAGATMTVNADVPVGTNQGAWTGATLKFNNKATNQDACKGATVNLSYAIG
jgi:hypothetical protein